MIDGLPVQRNADADGVAAGFVGSFTPIPERSISRHLHALKISKMVKQMDKQMVKQLPNFYDF